MVALTFDQYEHHAPTQSPVAGKLLVDLLHPLYVDAAGLGMVHHGLGVVDSNDTLGHLLHFLWGGPRIIDVFSWKTPQYGQIASESRERKEKEKKINLA